MGENMAVRSWLLATFLVFPLLQLSLSNPSEFSALLDFKSASDPFNSLSSWSNSTHPCSGTWLGVSCTHAHVTHLLLDRLNLTGSIRPLARLPRLRVLSLNHNRLSSPALNLSSWTNLKHLYLSNNRFTGDFPAGVSSIPRIRRLVLSHNKFSGEIPMAQLTRLPRLLTLRLEQNSFSGTIFPISSSSSITDFNVSGNNLAGQIPEWLSRFPQSSFAGNSGLCGKPLGYSCSNGPEKTSGRKRKGTDALAFTIIMIDAVAAVGIIVAVGWCCCRRKHRTRVEGDMGGSDRLAKETEEMVIFEGCKGFFKVDDLLKASAELLGKGSVGSTYKVMLEAGGGMLAVKRAREGFKRKEVHGLMKEIGGLRHVNIVSLRAYYFSRDELLLVYDFLPNGSLHYLLHGNRGPGRTPLDWTTRLKLASGAARGLSFLHGSKKSRLAHGHLTSSNIIVDASGNACVADIGLHYCLPPRSSSSDSAYAPPEVAISQQSRLSQKADVYNFGVVLLEILTGKTGRVEREMSLDKWVAKRQAEGWRWEMLDLELWRYKEMEHEMKTLLQIACLCLARVPRDRPEMSMVEKMIEDIRMKGRQKDGSVHSPDLSSHHSSQSESTPNFTST